MTGTGCPAVQNEFGCVRHLCSVIWRCACDIRSSLMVKPSLVDLVWECGQPIVRQHVPKCLPNDDCGIFRIGHTDHDVGSIGYGGES